MPAVIDTAKCTGCEACVGSCPVETITIAGAKAVVGDACIDCGACVDTCPCAAIEMK